MQKGHEVIPAATQAHFEPKTGQVSSENQVFNTKCQPNLICMCHFVYLLFYKIL